MTDLVMVKFPNETRFESLDLASELQAGETVTNAAIASIQPGGLVAAITGTSPSSVNVSVGSGTDGQSFGVLIDVITSLSRVINITLAVVCNSQIAHDYQNVNLDAFNDLIGELDAGKAAVGHVAFMFPADFDGTGGQITWSLIDRNGATYSSGSAYNYLVTPLSDALRIEAAAVVNVPSDAQPTLDGQSYQIRWRLQLNGQTHYSYETLRVTSQTTTPVGVQDIVEMEGADYPLAAVFPQPFDSVSYQLFSHKNEKITNTVPVNGGTRTSDGWLYSADVTGFDFRAGLEPISVVWTGKLKARPVDTHRQIGRLFIVNSSILQAAADLRVHINKAHMTIANQEDLIFSDALLLSYLRSGRDYFNGAGAGMLTAFTMVNAQGSIREFWIRSSLVAALRAQYMAEAEKAFNFSGQAISLDVDRTQYYQSMADQLKSELDNELKPYKQNLIKKGINAGDGDMAPENGLAGRRGALGTVGITITPASGWSKWGGARWKVR